MTPFKKEAMIDNVARDGDRVPSAPRGRLGRFDPYRELAQFVRDHEILYRLAHPPYMLAIKAMKEARVRWSYQGRLENSPSRGNDMVAKAILDGQAHVIGKLNSLEIEALTNFSRNPPGLQRYPSVLTQQLWLNVGLFPPVIDTFDRFCELFIDAIGTIDILAVWGNPGEAEAVSRYCNSARLVRLHALEPFRFEVPWSAALEGKRILVVHPFADTIERQVALHRAGIWGGHPVLPEIELIVLKMPLSDGLEQNTSSGSWFDLLGRLTDQISDLDFDVALIGAGGMSLMLAAHIKRMGKVAIHTGGGTQILFGIRGRRWDNWPSLRPYYNEHWTRPSKQETPENYKKIEGGGYW